MEIDAGEIEKERGRLGIQLHADEISEILKAIKPPANFLVFGLGNDSVFWAEANKGGRTVFLEDGKKWVDSIRIKHPFLETYLVDYGTKLTDWKYLLEHPGELNLDLPNEISGVQWDVILVDGPAGYFKKAPGRMKSICAASRLIRKGGDVFVHDTEREVENAYCNRFLLPGNLVNGVEGRAHLRHYRII